MDPNATLGEMRSCMDEPTEPNLARLGELFTALDEWLESGGFLPKAWESKFARGGEVEPEEYRCVPVPTWTVIGIWEMGEPLAVGVLAGEHQVVGGDAQAFSDGMWAEHVQAGDAEEAEGLAVAGMLATLGDADEDDEPVEVTIRGHKFREDFEGAPLRCLTHPEFVVDLESGVDPAIQVGEHVGAKVYTGGLLADLSAMGGDEDWAGMDAADENGEPLR